MGKADTQTSTPCSTVIHVKKCAEVVGHSTLLAAAVCVPREYRREMILLAHLGWWILTCTSPTLENVRSRVVAVLVQSPSTPEIVRSRVVEVLVQKPNFKDGMYSILSQTSCHLH